MYWRKEIWKLLWLLQSRSVCWNLNQNLLKIPIREMSLHNWFITSSTLSLFHFVCYILYWFVYTLRQLFPHASECKMSRKVFGAFGVLSAQVSWYFHAMPLSIVSTDTTHGYLAFYWCTFLLYPRTNDALFYSFFTTFFYHVLYVAFLLYLSILHIIKKTSFLQ